MHVLVGTSGYSYKEWKGSFYPADLPNDDMLAYYGERFQTVEINNTFYRMPKESVLRAWSAQVGDGFRFVLKASRQITHIKRLKDVAEPVSYLLNTAQTLGRKLGAILFQLPPNMKKDVARLQALLAGIPKKRRVALEFRHDSWHDDEVYDTLRAHDAALCIADTDDGAPNVVGTAGWGYLRLRREAYDDAALAGWAHRLSEHQWSDAYVFFKHEDAGTGPALAQRFMAQFEVAT